MVFLDRNLECRVGIETADGCEMDVSREDGDADGVRGCDVLQHLDQLMALALVSAGCVVVVEVIEKIDTTVKVVDKAACDTEALVQELNRAHKRGGKNVLEPSQARVGNWDTKEDDQMLDWPVGSRSVRELLRHTVKNHLIGLWVVNLVTSTLGSGVKAEKSDASTETSNDASGVLSDIWAWVAADDVGWMLLLFCQDVDVASLLGILTDTAAIIVHGLRRIGGVGGDRWWKVMLEEEIVLVCCATDTAENVALHELLDIGTKAINNVVIIPKVELSDLAVNASEWFRVVPADVVGKVVVVALLPQLFWERILPALPRV